MAYDNPRNRETYSHLFDFGAAADLSIVIKGPKGKAGRLFNYGITGVTENFAASTITPKISVGTSGDADAYGDELVLTSVTTTTPIDIRSLYEEHDAGFSTYMLDRELPADTAVYMVLIGATGSPTGQATAFVTIEWND
jgi:hypothetical protein